MIKINTKFPIAYQSPDHLYPWGTKRDNHTSLDFVSEVHEYFGNRAINFLDLGCSGGQLVIDMMRHNSNNISIGLEGSDYSVKHGRANWPKYYNKNLFTCDISKPFNVLKNDNEVKFDIISAWEVLEHIPTTCLTSLFENVYNLLNNNGIFVFSICWESDAPDGEELHLTREEAEWWKTLAINTKFKPIGNELIINNQLCNYLFKNRVRGRYNRGQCWMTWIK